MKPCDDAAAMASLAGAERLWLFLDYDGTLAEFAPTPEDILPDEALIALIAQLAAQRDLRVAIISGRRLAHIQALLPVPGILMAGTYGLELQLEDGRMKQRVKVDEVRPVLDDLKAVWEKLLSGRDGFFLEDKGWTLAIHAKDAPAQEAAQVLDKARRQAALAAEQRSVPDLRLQGGHRFLEIGPRTADKKRTVEHLLAEHPWPGAFLVYLGDDDKDEVAFAAIQAHGGLAIAVGERLRESAADCWLPAPQAARRWLQSLVAVRRRPFP